MTDFKELREALEAGPTDGPWEAKRWTSEEGGCYGWLLTAGGYLLPLSDMGTDNPDECDANAAFIAAANPATVRSLLKELDEARRDAERWRFAMVAPRFALCELDDDMGDWLPVLDFEEIDAAMKEQQPCQPCN